MVTIITVVYNGAQHIEKTILSVLEQSYPNIEYIIIDGGSTDGTLDIIKRYNSKIAYWISEADDGIYNAMNKGIMLAHGELIGLINSDDFYDKDVIQDIVNSYLQHGNGCIYHGIMNIIDQDANIVDMLHPVQNSKFFMLTGCSIAHPTCMIPKDVYEKFGLYNEKMRIASDYDLLLRLIRNNVQPIFINKVICYFRQGGASSNIVQTAIESHMARIANNINPIISSVFMYRVFVFDYLKKVLLKLKLSIVIKLYRKFISKSHRIHA